MAKLYSFTFLTLNGFYKGANEDISWHRHGEEESQYAAESMKPGGVLLFGRVTYDMMASYWPTPMALENSREVAEGMNAAEKIVFSNTLKKAEWSNTRVISGNIAEAIKKLKEESVKDMTILGSGSIVQQLAAAGLIDGFQFMIDPVALGRGTPVFENMNQKLDLQLTDSKVFKSGVVLLSYRPLKN